MVGGLLFFAAPLAAQNTKGDQPAATPTTPKLKKGKPIKKGGLFQRLQSNRGGRAKNVFPQNGPYVNNPSHTPRGEKATVLRLPGTKIVNGRVKPRSASAKVKSAQIRRPMASFYVAKKRQPKQERPSSVRLPSSIKSYKTRPRHAENAMTKTAEGRSLKPRSVSGQVKSVFPQRGPYVHNPSSKPGKTKTVFPQSGPYVHNPSSKPKSPDAKPNNKPLNPSRRLSATIAQARSVGVRGAGFKSITSQFLTRGRKNVYWGKFSKKEKAVTTDIAGRKLRTRNYHSPKAGLVPRDTLPFFRKSPRDAKRGKGSTFGGFRSATSTGRAWKGNISGHPLRKGEARPNSEKTGNFIWPRRLSASRRGERNGRPLHTDLAGGSLKRGRKSNAPLPGKAPGLGANYYGAFAKRASGAKKGKLPGSASGKSWNNNRLPIQGRQGGRGSMMAAGYKGRMKSSPSDAGFSRMGLNFTGYKKASRPLKGGGSVSGRSWNNQNNPVRVKTGGLGTIAAGSFAGRAKTRGPLKGGGSVSGQLWNNQNKPVRVKTGGLGTIAAGYYSGRTKTRIPAKGGGSISGKLWNNRNTPVAVRKGGPGGRRAGTYSGNIKGSPFDSDFNRVGLNFTGYKKAKKPVHGGGSVSGRLWNNQTKPLAVRKGGAGSRRAGTYTGNIKGSPFDSHFNRLGLNFTGYTKAKKPVHGGGSISGKLWNNRNTPLQVRTGGKGTREGALFTGNIKHKPTPHTAGRPATFTGKMPGGVTGDAITRRGLNYTGDVKRGKKGIDNKHTPFLARLTGSKKLLSLPTTHIGRDEAAANFTKKGKRSLFPRYIQNPKAADASLKKDRAPDGLRLNVNPLNQRKIPVNAGHYRRGWKQDWNYVKGPNSAAAALKLREPGKATAKIGALQVNVKMKKHYDKALHPDAKYANSLRDNVKGERTLLMNLKLTWSKLFKKSDTQPRGLKQKVSKPRYDPKEKGLWYE